ncbi:hypothetical protein F5B17DRAFT_4879 [Nemania serpens]|nr:hypothetical protein F5B17DRAFT_4879 [Nemania serpens]
MDADTNDKGTGMEYFLLTTALAGPLAGGSRASVSRAGVSCVRLSFCPLPDARRVLPLCLVRHHLQNCQESCIIPIHLLPSFFHLAHQPLHFYFSLPYEVLQSFDRLHNRLVCLKGWADVVFVFFSTIFGVIEVFEYAQLTLGIRRHLEYNLITAPVLVQYYCRHVPKT